MNPKLLLLAALLLPACGSGTANTAQANGAAPTRTNAAEPATAAAAGAVTAQWLAGRWQAEGPDQCGAGDTNFTFDPNGGYAFMEEQGRWSLDGDRLTIEVTHASSDSGTGAGERNTTIVRAVGPDEAEFQSEGVPPIRVYRCTGPAAN